MKRVALARRTPLRAKTPLRSVNPERQAKLRAEQFGHRASWLMEMPCCVSGCPLHSGPPHHAKTRGAGGTKRDQVPSCWKHHQEIHSLGRISFERKYGLNLTELAVHYCGLYEHSFPRLVGRPGSDAETVPPSDHLSSPAVGTDSSAAGILGDGTMRKVWFRYAAHLSAELDKAREEADKLRGLQRATHDELMEVASYDE